MDAGIIQNNLWAELLKLAIFAVFVTSIIEVIKGISAVGIRGILKDLWGTLIYNTDMRPESIQSLNFAIALYCCWAFDYGVISKLIQTGTQIRHGAAGWLDYIGTASLIYTGADSLFRKFAAMRDSWKSAAKRQEEKHEHAG
jgi:hypothetical protein